MSPKLKHRPAQIPSLTGIRGVAALWVVLYHIQDSLKTSGILTEDGSSIISNGFRGVDLFFFLSGYVLMHVHQQEFSEFSSRAVVRFATLRALRVYPLSFVILILIACAVNLFPGFIPWFRSIDPSQANSYSALGFVQTALLANRWFVPDFGEWNGPTWSLSVEIVAYATFPLVAWMAMNAKSERLCIVIGLAILLVLPVLQSTLPSLSGNMTGRLSVVRAMACFPAGVLLYRVGSFAPGADDGLKWGALLSLISTMVLILILLSPRTAPLAPLCFAGIIIGVRFRKGIVNRVLSGPTAIFLGDISFALYLLNLVPLNILFWKLSESHASAITAIGASVAYLASLIAVSYLLHKYVELPVQRYGRRMIMRG